MNDVLRFFVSKFDCYSSSSSSSPLLPPGKKFVELRRKILEWSSVWVIGRGKCVWNQKQKEKKIKRFYNFWKVFPFENFFFSFLFFFSFSFSFFPFFCVSFFLCYFLSSRGFCRLSFPNPKPFFSFLFTVASSSLLLFFILPFPSFFYHFPFF